jgi:hypothetical protein
MVAFDASHQVKVLSFHTFDLHERLNIALDIAKVVNFCVFVLCRRDLVRAEVYSEGACCLEMSRQESQSTSTTATEVKHVFPAQRILKLDSKRCVVIELVLELVEPITLRGELQRLSCLGKECVAAVKTAVL